MVQAYNFVFFTTLQCDNLKLPVSIFTNVQITRSPFIILTLLPNCFLWFVHPAINHLRNIHVNLESADIFSVYYVNNGLIGTATSTHGDPAL